MNYEILYVVYRMTCYINLLHKPVALLISDFDLLIIPFFVFWLLYYNKLFFKTQLFPIYCRALFTILLTLLKLLLSNT